MHGEKNVKKIHLTSEPQVNVTEREISSDVLLIYSSLFVSQ